MNEASQQLCLHLDKTSKHHVGYMTMAVTIPSTDSDAAKTLHITVQRQEGGKAEDAQRTMERMFDTIQASFDQMVEVGLSAATRVGETILRKIKATITDRQASL